MVITVHLLRDQDLRTAFDRASPAYDRLVGASPGYHAQLRLSAARLRLPHGGAGLRVLDVGCGTGASTAALLRVAPAAGITAVDASPGMLERARAKRWPDTVTFVRARAEELGGRETAGPFDAVFAAYLLRNVTEPGAVLRGLRRLLRPGGRLAVHEYALSGSAVHRVAWTVTCWGIVIPAGAWGPGGAALYRHLWRSVLDFDTVGRLRDRVVEAGFDGVRVASMPGWQRGIVHTVVACRPEEAA